MTPETAPQVLACPGCGSPRFGTTNTYVVYNRSAAGFEDTENLHKVATPHTSHVFQCASCARCAYWYGGHLIPIDGPIPVEIPTEEQAEHFIKYFRMARSHLKLGHAYSEAAGKLLEGEKDDG